MITKDHMIEAIQTLLEDATVEDAMDRRYVFSKIERGLQQIPGQGKGIAARGSRAGNGRVARLTSLLLPRANDLDAAHPRLQHVRHADRAVGLLIVLHDGDHHARQRQP